jgi:tetratricopeptide (TPR) repeat protein
MKALLIVLLLAAQQPDDVLQKIGAAARLVDEGKVDKAIAALERIVAEHPDNETAKYELALAYTVAGDAENCRKILEPLAATDRVNILGMLGNCLDELGQTEKAIAMYRRALKLAPADSQAAYNLAVTLSREGKAGEARELLETDTRANPAHASAHLFLGTVFEAQNFRVPAVMSYLRFLALEASPRAKDAATRLQALLDLGVEQTKAGGNVTIDSEAPKDEGDYAPVAMGFALASAGRLLPEKEKLSDFEKVRQQVASSIAMFVELTADHNDYTAAVHRPFFAAMQKETLVDTFAGIAITPLRLRGTDEWVTRHIAELTRYSKWITPQMERAGLMLPPK